MEKVIYALWRKENESREEFNRQLQEAAREIAKLDNIRGVRLNIQDADVVRGEGLRQIATDPQMDAAVQIWIDVSHDAFRKPVDDILNKVSGRIAAWLTTEASIIPNTKHPPKVGERTEGWSQFCFLQKPERFTYDEWRHNWQELHTRVGIDTQANFEYIQHLVVRTLIPGPKELVSMVEECFPTDAMDDPAVFYDAVGNPEKLKSNLATMMKSCAGFIDMGGVQTIDVLPTSQYQLKATSWR